MVFLLGCNSLNRADQDGDEAIVRDGVEIVDRLTIDENLWSINFGIKFNFKIRNSYDLQKFLGALIENLDTGTRYQAFNSVSELTNTA